MTCPVCGKELSIGDWPFCGRNGSHDSVLKTTAQRFQPVVVFKDKNGNTRFPGRSDARVPKGYERVELKTTHEVRKFEKEINRSERERWDRHKIREEMTFAPARKELRADLVNQMQSFSSLGKAFARLAMKKNDEKPRKDFDAGFHVEAFS